MLMACGKNGATCWLAGAVRNLQKRVELLETRDAAPALVVEHISQAPAGYTAHAPVMENIPPEPSVCAVPAPDAEYFSTAPAVIYAAPAPTVFAVPASVGECFSPAPEVSYAHQLLWRNTFLQFLQCIPHLLLSWSTSHQRQLGTQGLHLMRRSTSSR